MSHIEYEFDGSFQSLIQNGLVVVDFFTTWCGPCQKLKPILLEGANQGCYTLVAVDCDRDSEGLGDAYGVSSIPHVVVFRDGVQDDSLSFTGFDENKALELRN